jgi:hypothetical protein
VIGEEGRREVIGEVGRREPIDDFPEGKIDRGKSFLQWFFFFTTGEEIGYVMFKPEKRRSARQHLDRLFFLTF